jgi:excisionase family DNA binding protein
VSIANAELRKNYSRRPGIADLIGAAFTNKAGIAERYGVSPRTVDNWIQQRRIPYIKCARLVRFNVAKCDAALSRFEVKEVA